MLNVPSSECMYVYVCVSDDIKNEEQPSENRKEEEDGGGCEERGKGGGIIDSFKHYLIWMEVLLLKVRYRNDHKCS